MEIDYIALIVQTGAVGLAGFIVWVIAFKALPENRKAINQLQDNFIAAIERHEESHRAEVKTIVDAHTQGQDERLRMLNTMQQDMAKQTEILRSTARS